MRCAYLLLLVALSGCATQPAVSPATGPLGVANLLNKQIYQMSPVEAGHDIAQMHQSEPDLRKRIAAIGRRNIGQPYKLNLLGEFPYQLHDSLPMFSLDHSDCVVSTGTSTITGWSATSTPPWPAPAGRRTT